MRTSSRIDNVNVRPNVNNDINVNVNVRPNFAVWTMKRSSTFANEDSSTSIYRCDVHTYVTINISIRYDSEWVTFCCSYVFCHKMVNNGQILVFEVSIEPY